MTSCVNTSKDPNEADLENVAGQQGGDPLILLADTGGEPIAGLLYETLAPTQGNAGSEADIAWQQAAEVVVGARQEATPRIMKDSARARTVRSASVEAALPGIFPGDLGTNAAELCTTLALEFSKARDNASGGCSSSSSSYGGGSGGGGGGGTFGPGDVGLTLPFGIVFELLVRQPRLLCLLFLTPPPTTKKRHLKKLPRQMSRCATVSLCCVITEHALPSSVLSQG